MRGRTALAIAVRRSSGDIIVHTQRIKSLAQHYPVLRLPFIRGILALGESLFLGMKALTFSANQIATDENEQLTTSEITVTFLVGLVLSILLFVIFPIAVVHWLRGYWPGWTQNLAEGLLRVVIFLGYIIVITRLKDIQRVFAYHGAEHKVIHTFEAGLPLTLENSYRYSTLHPRCGTSFLLMFVLFTIFLYSFLPPLTLWWRIASRLLTMPLIAGFVYEMIKFSGKYSQQVCVRALIAPGLWLQKLTTREPDNQQLEVAIKALQAVLVLEGTGKTSLQV